jgi:hypothetical protein
LGKLRATPEALSVKRVAAEETGRRGGKLRGHSAGGKHSKNEQRNKALFISRISTKEPFPLSRLFWFSHDIRDSGEIKRDEDGSLEEI